MMRTAASSRRLICKGQGMNAAGDGTGLILCVSGTITDRGYAKLAGSGSNPGDQMRGAGEPVILAGLMQQGAAGPCHSKGRSVVGRAFLRGPRWPSVPGADLPRCNSSGVGAHSGLPYQAAPRCTNFPPPGGPGGQKKIFSRHGAWGQTGSNKAILFATVHLSRHRRHHRSRGNMQMRIAQNAFPRRTEVLDDARLTAQALRRRTILWPRKASGKESSGPSRPCCMRGSGGDSAGVVHGPTGPDASRENDKFFPRVAVEGRLI